MRTITALALLLALAGPAHAQQANLTTPEVITATKLVVAEVDIDRTNASVRVEFQTSADAVKRSASFGTSSNAELLSFITAIGTARSGETGTVPRRFNFRVLGWLLDNNKLRDEAGNALAVTLVP